MATMMILHWFAWFNTGRTKSSNGMEATQFSHPSYFFPRICVFLILKHLSTNHFIWSINLATHYLISILFAIKSTSHNKLLVQESCLKTFHRPEIVLKYYQELLFFENMMKTRNSWLNIFGIGDCISPYIWLYKQGGCSVGRLCLARWFVWSYDHH